MIAINDVINSADSSSVADSNETFEINQVKCVQVVIEFVKIGEIGIHLIQTCVEFLFLKSIKNHFPRKRNTFLLNYYYKWH